MAQENARAPISGEVDAIVVGAGFGGLYMLHKLRGLGLTVQGFEAGGDVGGTWYWNRYPGARCDIPSLFYSYNFSEELREDWKWTERYAAQPEILAYAGHVADRFDLRPLVAFETRVQSAHFDEANDLWRVSTDKGDAVAARWLVMATGCLSTPRPPRIPGADSFEGRVFHTGAWPHEGVDFTGRRVAVIGTGSSAIQSIPQIAKQADAVSVFQRTANFSIPARNAPLTETDFAAFKEAYPAYIAMVRSPGFGFTSNPLNAMPPTKDDRMARYEELWGIGGAGFLMATGGLLTDIEINDEAAEFVRGKIAEMVEDPDTAEALKPRSHPIGTKRLCVDIDYYDTYNRPNVTLVDLNKDPIQEITPVAVRTQSAVFAVDDLVFATGFDAMTGALLAIDIKGAGGIDFKQAWAEGPKSYLGLAVAGFPNMFTITGPGSPSVLSNMITSIEQHVEWIGDCIERMRSSNRTRIEATNEAQEAWVAKTAAVAAKTLFPRAASWYMGANIPGKVRVFMPYIGQGYRKKCDDVAAADYEGFTLA